MEKAVFFTAVIQVNDEGQLDESTLRDAIADGIDIAHREGNLTLLDDTSTEFRSWKVSHIATVHAGSETVAEAQEAIAKLRSLGYAVAAFSPSDLGSMKREEMEPFLLKAGTDAIEETPAD